MLKRFFPILPSNCTSTNSVSCSISLLRMVPLPKRLCITLSPGLYCCPFGLAGGVGVGGGGGVAFLADGTDGGTVGDEYVPGRGDRGEYAPGLPLPNVRPLSRDARLSWL